jgi:hypothetical protein
MSRLEYSRRTSQSGIVSLLVLAIAGQFLATPLTSLAADQLGQVGRWSDLVTFSPEGAQIVHQVVMRGLQDSTRVLFWGQKTPRLWKLTSLDTLSPSVLVPVGVDHFCGSHSALPDGRVLVTGGSAFKALKVGIKNLNIFDATLPDSAHWTPARNMAEARWYATNTSLNDGRVLITSGYESFYVPTFGGRLGGALTDSVWAYAQSDTTLLRRPSVTGTPPSARERHAAIWDPINRRTIVFGGDDGSYRSDVRALSRTYGANEDAEYWSWQSVSPTGGPPAGRAGHSFIYSAHDQKLVILGGRDATSARSDIWALSVGTPGSEQWTQLTSPPAGFSARMGHVAIYDPAPSNQERMIVFGGTDGATSYFGDVWSYSLQSGTWNAVTATGGPSGREGCVGFGRRKSGGVQFYVFGGKNASGYFNETWLLTLGDGSNSGTWTKLSLASDAFGHGAVPRPRAYAASVLSTHAYNGRLFITGGQDSTGAALNDSCAWWLPIRDTLTVAEWVKRVVFPTPPARYGHTMVDESDEFLGVTALRPERFDPNSGSSPQGGAEVLNYPLNAHLYPFMFLLPNGKLLYAGSSDLPTTDTWLLDLNPQGGGWSRINPASPDACVSAVMYRPGKVMKCGHPTADEMPTDTISFNFNGLPGNWASTDNALGNQDGRTRLNLTLLPNGKVLATGGISQAGNPRKDPYIWNPDSLTWGAKLAQEPAPRGYHSTAVLLPDGRVLSAGGSDPTYQNTMAIYWPPYLFNANGSFAHRPQITYACNTIAYGEKFKLTVADSADITTGACIIRPSAVTHSFNQDQRYLPLTMVRESGSQTTFSITMVASDYEAPPGDYMLFVLKRGVPSVAKWIRLVHDTVNPPAEGSLAADIGTESSITVSWTAPDGGGTCGRAAQYDLRWSADPIYTQSDFNNAQGMGTGEPKFPGSLESATLDGQSSCTTRYFALKTKDVRGGWSNMDTAEGSTTCGGCCSFLTAGGPGATPEASATDVGRSVPLEGASFATVTSRQTAKGFSVERQEGASPSWRLRSLSAEEARAFGADTTGALVLSRRDQDGVRQNVSISHLRGGVGIGAAGPGREIIGLGSMLLDHVESRAPLGKPSGQRLMLASARHSRLGERLAALRDSGGRMDLQPGDTLDIGYVADTTAVESVSPHFLMLDSGTPAESSPGIESSVENVPLRFALYQNQPNPFARTTVFRFDLPRRESVSLDVMDVQGRRIERVVRGAYAPGQHAVEWMPGPNRIRPGVYLYRIVAGTFQAQKKLIVLP